jgi:hypothetical protein
MQTQRALGTGLIAILGIALSVPFVGCSSSKNSGTAQMGDDGGSSGSNCTGFNCSSGDDGGGSDITMTCPGGTNFQCTIPTCQSGGTTSISGTVYDPAGQVPLYNVAVYVPNITNLPDLPDGVSCSNCTSWYTQPVVSTLTDTSGQFTLTGMPAGANIPLVVQVGKWRMKYTLSNVKACATNQDAASLAGTSKLRLPRNHTEGSIPNIAVSTGAADTLECLLRRIGVDASEYTGTPTIGPGVGRVHIFQGGDTAASLGGALTQGPTSKQSYSNLWNNDADMEQFDVVLLSCEGQETAYLAAGPQVLSDYLNAGGRVFASHYHYQFFLANPTTNPFQMVTPPLATWTPEGIPNKSETVGPSGDMVSYPGDIMTTTVDGGAFPEGMALQSWLGHTGALTNGQLPIWFARHNADLSATNAKSQPWIKLDPSVTGAPNAAEYFSFDTPLGTAATEQCGRAVYSDLHVSGGIGIAQQGVTPDYASSSGFNITPDGCAMHPLTPQEKALEFMIFDLSSCLTPIGQSPMPPPPK